MMKRVPSKTLLLIGWAMFLLSCFLPVNISIGGLTDPGQAHVGFINLMYSFFSFAIIFEGFGSEDVVGKFDLISLVGLGVCNFLMLISPAMLWLKGRKIVWARNIMIVAVLYVCTVGFIFFRNFPLLYGHYVWCLSFVVAAIALIAKVKEEIRLT